MKIINTDNFNREDHSDSLVCENVSECYGEIIVNALNSKLSGNASPNYYRLVPDNYELYEFKP